MKNDKVFITGATGSIGQAVAAEFSCRGYELVLHYNKNEQAALKISGEIKKAGGKAVLVGADISRVEGIKKMFEEASKELSGFNVLVHCAAGFMRTAFDEVDEKIFDDVIAVDLKAAFFVAQVAARSMKDGGRMIFLSDIAAQRPYAGYLPYCMAKAGVDSLVRGLAKKLAPKISVNAIAPYIVTRPAGMSDAGWNDLIDKAPMRRESPPREIARLVGFLAEASPSLTGQVIAVDGGRTLG